MRRWLLLAGLLAGCASSRPPADAPVAPSDSTRLLADEEAEARRAAAPAPPPEAAAPAPPPAPAPPAACTSFARPGVVRRSAVVSAVDRGLGQWLQQVRVNAVRKGARFVGWQIEQLPDDPCYRQVDLQPGDIVTRVNGSSLEKPGQANDVFQGLRSARALDVQLLRQGAARRLSLAIAD